MRREKENVRTRGYSKWHGRLFDVYNKGKKHIKISKLSPEMNVKNEFLTQIQIVTVK